MCQVFAGRAGSCDVYQSDAYQILFLQPFILQFYEKNFDLSRLMLEWPKEKRPFWNAHRPREAQHPQSSGRKMAKILTPKKWNGKALYNYPKKPLHVEIHLLPARGNFPTTGDRF